MDVAAANITTATSTAYRERAARITYPLEPVRRDVGDGDALEVGELSRAFTLIFDVDAFRVGRREEAARTTARAHARSIRVAPGVVREATRQAPNRRFLRRRRRLPVVEVRNRGRHRTCAWGREGGGGGVSFVAEAEMKWNAGSALACGASAGAPLLPPPHTPQKKATRREALFDTDPVEPSPVNLATTHKQHSAPVRLR
mmetsp:Transcript_8207/g.27264  ORF Transcript_8207/g.27264 Transcript_8207/m.27264 type:complete len:200 (+) Transcript_8207:1060-1659(+)